jgi:hypothetical protein
MAAGLGFKTFNTGDVLSAADVNGYLMQGVLVFASTAARDSAITAPAEGQFAFTKDTNSLFYYDGAAWVASGATGDIEGVTAGTGISGGGTSGTVTITNSMATAIDAKGDLVVGTGADTFSKLTVGSNNTILTADSSTATGLKWAAAAGGGSGLTFISRTAFSNVASQAFDDVFTSSYYSYIARIEYVYAATGSDDLQLQFRYAGPTTQTSGYYGATFEVIYNGVTTVYGSNNASAGGLGGQEIGGTPQGTTAEINFAGVGNQSEIGAYYGISSNFPGSGLTIFNGQVTGTNRLYTGFLLKSTSSNITGAVSIYGLAKS